MRANYQDVFIVIPTFRASTTIDTVINNFKNKCNKIIVVSDNCPERSEETISDNLSNKVIVIRNKLNFGVGKSFLLGADKAVKEGAEIIVKVDSDDQMDPKYIDEILELLESQNDFAKGNRYLNLDNISEIPMLRRIFQIIQSIFFKLTINERKVFDVVNGYFGITKEAYLELEKDKLSNRFYFETDLIYELSQSNRKIAEFYTYPRYNLGGKSNIIFSKEIFIFLFKNMRRYLNKKFKDYFIADFNLGSIFLLISSFFFFVTLLFICWLIYKNIFFLSGASIGESVLFYSLFMSLIQFLIAFLIFDNLNNER